MFVKIKHFKNLKMDTSGFITQASNIFSVYRIIFRSPTFKSSKVGHLQRATDQNMF